MPVVPATQEVKVGESWSKPGLGKKKKKNNNKNQKQKDSGVNQVIEPLPSKPESLNSIPATTKKKKKSQSKNKKLILFHPVAFTVHVGSVLTDFWKKPQRKDSDE
jgi:hypothetical protein